MAIEIIVPRLGWSMEEGAFVAWLKKDGDPVKAGDPLFSIEGDKAVQEIESIDSGFLRIAPNAPKAGDPIRVGGILGHLVSAEEIALQPGWAATDATAAQSSSSQAPAFAAPSALLYQAPQPSVAPSTRSRAISPRALRVAAELGVDWTTLQGSGRTGRIREKDVRAAASPSSGHTSRREVIAQRLMTSLQSTVPVTLHTTADAGGLVKLYSRWKAAADTSKAAVPSYTDMFLKLAAAALQQHPALNARWDGNQLARATSIDIGLAVDTEAGLLVPVIRDVSGLSVDQIACRSRELIERARSRRLSAIEMQGGTFTITSLGPFGIDAFTPIIHYPQCAILGVGRIHRQPVASGDKIVLGDVVTLSLTFDHRALDGAPAARFLQTLRGLMENASGHLPLETVLNSSCSSTNSHPG